MLVLDGNLLAGADDHADTIETAADDPAQLYYSSGTTGLAKGHPPRPPLHPRPRGVHLLSRRPRWRVLPRHGGVGLGGRDRPASGAVAPRRDPVRLSARGRLRPREAARGPVQARSDQRLHDAHGDAGDDGRWRRRRALPATIPHRLLGRRAAEPRGDPLVPRAVRASRCSTTTGSPSPTRSAPTTRSWRCARARWASRCRAGTCRSSTRTKSPVAAGRTRRDLPARAVQPALPARLLEQPRGFGGDLRGRLVPHQGRRATGRGRLLLVRGPRRRRDHLCRLPDRPFEVESACIEHPAVLEAAAVASPDEKRGKS